MRVYFLSKQKVLLSDHLWKYAIYNKQQQNSVGHFLNQKDKQKIPALKEFTGYQSGKEGIYDFTEELSHMIVIKIKWGPSLVVQWLRLYTVSVGGLGLIPGQETRELPRCLGGKIACQFRRCRQREFSPWVKKIPWNRKWQPTLIFFLGKSLGQWNLASVYSPWGCKELDMTEHACTGN